MSNYKLTILIRQDVSLYYFRTNITLYIMSTYPVSYRGSFIKVDQTFWKISARRKEYWIIFFFYLQGCILYPGLYLENKYNYQT